MGHFHALNLSGVLDGLGEAEWSVGDRGPVALEQMRSKCLHFYVQWFVIEFDANLDWFLCEKPKRASTSNKCQIQDKGCCRPMLLCFLKKNGTNSIISYETNLMKQCLELCEPYVWFMNVWKAEFKCSASSFLLLLPLALSVWTVTALSLKPGQHQTTAQKHLEAVIISNNKGREADIR